MSAPATPANQSPLEAALREVRSTLDELLLAAQEQHAAVAARDRDRIESVTRQQERLSARLARAERLRMTLQGEASLTEAIASLPATDAARLDALRSSIGSAVRELQSRQNATARLLAHSIDLTRQALEFIQRLVVAPNPVYGGRQMATQSFLVELRA